MTFPEYHRTFCHKRSTISLSPVLPFPSSPLLFLHSPARPVYSEVSFLVVLSFVVRYQWHSLFHIQYLHNVFLTQTMSTPRELAKDQTQTRAANTTESQGFRGLPQTSEPK
jgi:hypothetical protein